MTSLRVTTRLLIATPSPGRVRLSLAWSSVSAGFVEITGTEFVPPPASEMTAAEFAHWCDSFNSRGAGWECHWLPASPLQGPLALVEVRDVIDVPARAVGVRLRHSTNRSGARSMRVIVSNRWTRTIPAVEAWYVFANEQPQAIDGTACLEAGGEDPLFQAKRGQPADLFPRRRLAFVMGGTFFAAMRSRAAALSPNRFRIELRTNGRTFAAVPGPELAAFFDTE